MGEYVRKCKRNAGTAVMGVDHGGVSTSKRMKIDSENFEPFSSNVCLGNHDCLMNSPATLENSGQLTHPGDLCSSSNSSSNSSSDHVLASRCSSNECLRSVDLEADGFENENSTYTNNKFSRELSPLSNLCGDSDEMESTAKKSTASHQRKSPARKMPSTAEIEEFFSVAEKYEQKRFADKYNYDVVKDVPLEGRFQWARLKP